MVGNTLEELLRDKVDGGTTIKNDLHGVIVEFSVNTRSVPADLSEILVFSGDVVGHLDCI